jgi:hypothetical protein
MKQPMIQLIEQKLHKKQKIPVDMLPYFSINMLANGHDHREAELFS